MLVLAHGVGGRRDLPIPFSLTLVAGVLVVAVSFVALGVLWRQPRFDRFGGRPLPLVLQRFLDARGFRYALQLIGLVLTASVAIIAIFGPDDTSNPAPGFVYVLFWVGIVPASLVFGPVWRQLNPLRTMVRGWRGFATLPAWVGYWPAVAGLLAFTWLELVSPTRASTHTIVVFFACYGAAQLIGALVFGVRWFDRCDGFEAYSTVVGSLAPVGRRPDGRLVVRNPFNGLAGLESAPGLVALVSTMFGATVYDSFSHAQFWVSAQKATGLSGIVTGTGGLVGTIAAVGLSYTVATRLCGMLGDVPALPQRFAHSIVPIAVGYVGAHYFSLFVFEGGHTIALAANSGGSVDYTLLAPALIAIVQVTGVVIGHVLGVVAAHDRAIGLFGHAAAVIGQLPLTLLMVGYTFTGLYLLFSG
ncbi:hypothetical protein [Lentzea sp. NPDC051838]|uniref:hypothetical protein n=1 Tax=Lentzea sp. NPDC051838 TaxID=3154849 RepID=UPI00343E3758